MRNHIGDFADSEFRYTFNQVFTGGSSTGSPGQTNQLSNATSNRLTETLVSGNQFTRLLWTVVADADYIRESIVNPNAHVLQGPTYSAGGRSLMPPDYGETLKAEQIDQIVAYLLTLK